MSVRVLDDNGGESFVKGWKFVEPRCELACIRLCLACYLPVCWGLMLPMIYFFLVAYRENMWAMRLTVECDEGAVNSHPF